MSERQKLLLRLIGHGECTIYGAMANMEATQFAVSRMRNTLCAQGLIKTWANYGDVMELTERGRAMLSRSHP
jgi:hypothetical protein